VVYIIICIGVRAAPLFENEQLVSGERKQDTVRRKKSFFFVLTT
jgi:hypothetical protein